MKKTVLALSFGFVCSLFAGTPTLRVMPLGDSITHGTPVAGGYRLPLYQMLTNAHYRVDMVGNETTNPADALKPEIQHEGHSGWVISNASNGLYEKIDGWLNAIEDPDVVLIHIGTNDSGASDFANRIDKLDALVTRIVEKRPYAHIVVSTLMKRNNDGSLNRYNAITSQFNPFVQPLVERHQQAGHRVHFLDMHALLDLDIDPASLNKTNADFSDGLHPNAAGYAKMAAGWYGVITQLFQPNGDANPPVLARAENLEENPRQLKVVFSKPVAAASVETAANWRLSGMSSPTVTAAVLSDDCHFVTLTLDMPIVPGNHTITLTSVSDLTEPVHTSTNLSLDFNVFMWGHETNVPEEAWRDYQLVYAADLPTTGTLATPADLQAFYKVDNSDRCSAFDRVAYYMEIRETGGTPQWVWVSMDAWTDDVKKIGVPYHAANFNWKCAVNSLSVWSNVADVQTGTGHAGCIEFWPYNYSEPPTSGYTTTSNAFDYDDKMGTDGAFGSMQVHDLTSKKTIFAFNHFHDPKANTCIGIGTCPTANRPDWTHENNGAKLDVRRLKVFVRPVRDTTPPVPGSAKIGSAGTQLFLDFNEPIDERTLASDAFSLGVEKASVRLLDDQKTVCVTLASALNPAGGDTITVSGVRDLSGNACAPTQMATVPYGIPADVTARVAAAQLEGYVLVYATDFPATGNFVNGDYPYWYDQSSATGAIDRVAYYMELDPYGNIPTYCFTSFDAPTQYRRALGVPLAANSIAMQQKVSNAYVASNVSGCNLGNIPDGCSIEFWSTSYGKENSPKLINGTDANYDVGDRFTQNPDVAGHGSMQVNYWQGGLTLWSITNMGTDNQSIGLGFGNSSISGHTDAKDWTFGANGGDYWRRRLFVFVRPKAERTPNATQEQRAEQFKTEIANVIGSDAVEGYRVVAAANTMPDKVYLSDANWAAQNFYTVDLRDTVKHGSFDRVAYFIQLQAPGDTAPRYVWTAMDAFTPNAKCVGVPFGGYYFKRPVTNLDVISNDPGVDNGTGLSTGTIEFWASNYAQGSVSNWNGSATLFDWDDKDYTTAVGHGSMQVHNINADHPHVIWSLSRFNNGNQPGFGIGTNPKPSNNDLDWTFTGTGGTLQNVRVVALVRDREANLKSHIENLAGSGVLDGFELMWSIGKVPDKSYVADNNAAWLRENLYEVDNTGRYPKGSIARVAYFMEVQYSDSARDSGPRYVLAVIDPFSPKAHELGIPIGGYAYQTGVGNMDVYSNDPNITSVHGSSTGCVEFWASNYAATNSSNPWGGSGSSFDWNDSGFSTGTNGHGSMQLHNWGKGEVLFAFNRFNKGNEVGLGVGKNLYITSTADIDYTHTPNATKYKISRFCCFVLPRATCDLASRPVPSASRAVAALDRDQVAIRFNRALVTTALANAEFTIDGGAQVTGVRPYDNQWVILTVTGLAAGRTYAISYSGVEGADGGSTPGTVNVVVPAAADVATPAYLADVPEAANYRLAYRIDLPTTRAGVWTDTPYFVDEEFFRGVPFDRVAYSLELVSGGVSKWVWTSMDAFTPLMRNLPLPTADRGAMFQQKIANLNVRASSNAGVLVKEDGIQTGNIEFWPSNYSVGKTLNLGGDDALFDWDDTGGSTGTGYGSMQVHNYGAGETLFAINSFGSNSSDKLCVGIGNYPNPSSSFGRDWTHAYNAADFTLRRLSVYVRETAQPLAGVNGPALFNGPVDTVCHFGEPFALAVAVGGATRFHWFHNGVAIPGAVQAAYQVEEAKKDDAGAYTVIAYNKTGSVQSASATVRVILPATIILVR